MDIDLEPFRIHPSTTRPLARPTRVAPLYADKSQYEELLERQVRSLHKLQELLYASRTHALLVVFQGMDTAGKDGAIEHVMSGVNPQGCRVTSFKHPSAVELEHDFLWRCARELPVRGMIGIFNRSYYEEVVVVRVHPELLEAEGVVDEKRGADGVWRSRFQSILAFEDHLWRSGTRIVKVFLHLSKDVQRERLLARIDDPDKHWKFDLFDVRERNFWDDYAAAYDRCIAATSTARMPWYVVPADDKPNARLIVSQIVIDALECMGLSYPKLSQEKERELASMREQLAS